MPSHHHYNYFFLAASIANNNDIIPIDHFYSYYKKVNFSYKYIVAESFPYYIYYIRLSWDYNIKKFSGVEFKRV